MKKQAFILLLIITLLFMTLACVGSEEVNRAASRQSSAATATSAALEFHVQLTLTAADAAAAQGNRAQVP